MSRIIFDIETAGQDFDCLEPAVQEYLLRWADTEGERQEVRESLSFYPLTVEIVAIGMYDPDKNKGFIYFQNNADPLLPFEEEDMRYETGTEQRSSGSSGKRYGKWVIGMTCIKFRPASQALKRYI